MIITGGGLIKNTVVPIPIHKKAMVNIFFPGGIGVLLK